MPQNGTIAMEKEGAGGKKWCFVHDMTSWYFMCYAHVYNISNIVCNDLQWSVSGFQWNVILEMSTSTFKIEVVWMQRKEKQQVYFNYQPNAYKVWKKVQYSGDISCGLGDKLFSHSPFWKGFFGHRPQIVETVSRVLTLIFQWQNCVLQY